MANRTAALARSLRNSMPAIPAEDGGRAWQVEDGRIIHEDGNGRQTAWATSELKQEFARNAKQCRAVPNAVQFEWVKIKLVANPRRDDFLRETLPKLELSADQRFNLASLYLEKTAPDTPCAALPCFDVRDVSQQRALAEICIERKLSFGPVFAQVLDQLSPTERRDLAFRLAQSEYRLSEHVDKLGLDELDRHQLALSLVRRQGALALKWLPGVCCADRKQAHEIALACGPSVLGLPELQKLGLASEEQRMALALHFAHAQPHAFSETLYGNKLFSKAQIAQLMEECLSTGRPVSDIRLAHNAVGDSDLGLRWALACAGEEADEVARRFPLDVIPDARQRLRVARVCMDNDPETAAWLHNFKLEAGDDLHALAMSCARSGPAILHALPALALSLEQKLEILQACATQPSFHSKAPSELLRECKPQDLLQLVDKAVRRDSIEGFNLIIRLLEENLLEAEHVLPALRLCVSEGIAPQTALGVLGLDEASSPERSMEFLALWLQCGPSPKKLQKECRRHQHAFGGNACQRFLKPLAEGRPLPHAAVSDELPAIGGKPELGLHSMSDTEIAFLAALTKERKLGAIFVGPDKGQTAWRVKPGASFNNILGKHGIDMTRAQCEQCLGKLHITGTRAQAAQAWQEIGQHAYSMGSLRELARMDKPKDLPDLEPLDAEGLSWSVHQQRWLSSVLMQIETRKCDNAHVRLLIPLLQRLAVMRDESMRRRLTLLVMDTPPEQLARLSGITTAQLLPRLCMLPFLDANTVLTDALDADARNGKRIKNHETARPLIDGFLALRDIVLPLETKHALLRRVLAPGSELKSIGTRLQSLVSLLRLSLPSALKLLDANSSDTLEGQLQSALSEALGMDGLDLPRYMESFGSMREPGTLPTYAGRLKPKRHAMQGLRSFVDGVLNGDYPGMRYRGIAMLDKMDTAWLQRWKSEKVQSCAGTPLLMAPGGAGARPSHARILRARILDYGHLELGAFPHLARYLEVQAPVAEQFAQQAISAFETAMIACLQNPDAQNLKTASDLLQQAQPGAELLNDLKMVLSDLNGERPSGTHANKILRFTDNFEQMLRMGSDVPGSCLRVDGDPDRTRGLIGTILDGRSRLCTIEDETGKLLGRLVLRLMWDETAKQPCLMAEPIYPDTLDLELRKLLTDFARDRARELQLDLICFGRTSAEPDFRINPDTDRVHSVLRYGDFEYPPYADSAQGVLDEGNAEKPRKLLWRVYRHHAPETLQLMV